MPSAHALGLGDVRLKLTRPIGAFFGSCSELWQFSVSKHFSPQPVTQAVGRLKVCKSALASYKRELMEKKTV